jgi:putative transposase
MLSQRRSTAAARRFFNRAIGTNGVPERIAIDQSGANLASLQSLNAILKFTGTGRIINIVQSKYLNNMVEQDHRFIKKSLGQCWASRLSIQLPQHWLGLKSRT